MFHTAIGRAEWYEEFLDDAALAAGQAIERGENALESERRAQVRRYATALMADPRYNAPKATKGKREHLCQEINPDLNERTCARIVEEAENMAWLTQVSAPAADAQQAA